MVGILIFRFYLVACSASINLYQTINKNIQCLENTLAIKKNSTIVSCVVFLGPHSSQLYTQVKLWVLVTLRCEVGPWHCNETCSYLPRFQNKNALNVCRQFDMKNLDGLRIASLAPLKTSIGVGSHILGNLERCGSIWVCNHSNHLWRYTNVSHHFVVFKPLQALSMLQQYHSLSTLALQKVTHS